MFTTLVVSWGKKNLREFPWRKDNVSPYEVFVAEMLLKRTTAIAVARIYPIFIKKYSNIKKLSKSNIQDISKMLKTLGYFKRAQEISVAAKFIEKRWNGKFPSDKESLLTIPYVGEYTANAILSLSHGKPFPMIDSNVNRIISRVFLGKNYNRTSMKIITEMTYKLLPKNNYKVFNFALLDIGGTICLSRYQPCCKCPLNSICRLNIENGMSHE